MTTQEKRLPSVVAKDQTPENRERTAQESPPVLEYLYREHFHPLVKHLRLNFGDGPPDPEDVAQQAFENLHARGDLASISNIKHFIWACARNITISAIRAKQVQQKNEQDVNMVLFDPSGVEMGPERVYIAKEEVEKIKELVKRLPARRRRIFVLHRIHGLRPAEIARRLGIGRTAVVRHIAITTELIAQALERSTAENHCRKERRDT